MSIVDIVLDFNATVEAAALIDNITFTPVYLPQAVSLFSMSGGVVSMENASSCCLVLFGANSEPALATNVNTDRYNNYPYLSWCTTVPKKALNIANGTMVVQCVHGYKYSPYLKIKTFIYWRPMENC